MTYIKHEFKSYDKLYASQLNEMDEQIYNNTEDISSLKETIVPYAESIDWLNENGDTSKKYVLPDGYIYAWTGEMGITYHNANDGTGSLNMRPTPNVAAPASSENSGSFTTALITLDKSKNNCKVNISGLDRLNTNYYSPVIAYFYAADNSWLGFTFVDALGATLDNTILSLPCTIDLSLSPYWNQASKVRLLLGILINTNIQDKHIQDLVINFESFNIEEIQYSWKSTGALYDYSSVVSELQEDVGDLKIALAQSMVLPAESLEWLNENGDPDKRYVLPDQYIYSYQTKEVFIEYDANNGTGYLNKTPSGTWGTSNFTMQGMWTSSLIEIDPYTMGYGGIANRYQTDVTINGIEKVVPVYNGYSVIVYYYKQDGSQYMMKTNSDLGSINIAQNNEIPVPFTFSLKDGNIFNDSNWVNVYGVRIALGIASGADITDADIANLKVNVPYFDRTESVEGWYSTGQVHSSDKATQQNTTDIGLLQKRADALELEVEELQETIENMSLVDISTGQVLYAVGDSITYGYGIGGNDYSWVKHVIERNGYDAENSLNLGQSNLGFCTAAMSGDTITDVIDGTDFSGADIVTVALGVNDWKNYNATLTDFWNGMEYCFNKIRTDNPYCKIFYILPFSYKAAGLSSSKFETFYALGAKGDGNTERPYGHTMQAFIDMIKDKFEEDTFKAFHIHVIDMVECAAINRHNIDTALFDGLHPSAECNIELGKEIARRIALT